VTLFSLARGSLSNRRASVALTVLTIAISIALLVLVEQMRSQVREGFYRSVSGTDLIVGAPTSSVQLLLFSVFGLGNPTSNVSWDRYREIAGQPIVDWSIPISREEAARGVIRIANEHMSRALRVMSAERGVDQKSATLMSFGGAGGLHVCELAESLGMTRAVVPARSGVLSALGMLVARPGRQATASFLRRANAVSGDDVEQGFQPLVDQVRDELGAEGMAADDLDIERWIDCRYVGQSATLELPIQSPDDLVDAFHELHEKTFGHQLNLSVELVGLRVEARGAPRLEEVPSLDMADEAPDVEHDVPVMMRSGLSDTNIEGPAIVMDTDATTWVAENWRASLDSRGHLLLGHADAEQSF